MSTTDLARPANDSATTWTVGGVARLAGISVRTLHHYDEIGLLSPSRRTAAGHRHYLADDLDRLRDVLTGANWTSRWTTSPTWSPHMSAPAPARAST